MLSGAAGSGAGSTGLLEVRASASNPSGPGSPTTLIQSSAPPAVRTVSTKRSCVIAARAPLFSMK